MHFQLFYIAEITGTWYVTWCTNTCDVEPKQKCSCILAVSGFRKFYVGTIYVM